MEFIGIEDVAGVEREYGRQALGPPLTPEQLYERNWAMTVLSRATDRLAAEFAAAGKPAILEALKVFLTGDNPGVKYGPIAESLGMSEGAVRVAVHRLRDRFRALLRTEIAQTLPNPADPRSVDEELRYLLTVL